MLLAGGHFAMPEQFGQMAEAILLDTIRRGWRMSAFLSPGRKL